MIFKLSSNDLQSRETEEDTKEPVFCLPERFVDALLHFGIWESCFCLTYVGERSIKMFSDSNIFCITVYSTTDHYPRVWHLIVCYTFSVIACWKVGHCLRVDLTLGFILFSFRLVCFGGCLSYGWVRKGGRGITDFGICYLRLLATLVMRSFGIPSEVYRTDPVWKELITQGPRGVLSIW